MSIVKIMEEYGFASISTGGGCRAYSKDIICRGKAAYILVVNDGGLDLPESLEEVVYAGIYDFDTGDPIVEAEPFDTLKGYLDTLNESESDKSLLNQS
jgi:hypothetical protein